MQARGLLSGVVGGQAVLPVARTFATRAGLSIADQGVSGGTAFLISIYIGRYVGLEGLGLYAIAFSVSMIIFQFSNAAVLEAFSVYGSRSAECGREYLTFSLLLQVCLVAAITAVGALLCVVFHAISLLQAGDLQVFAAMLIYCNLFCFQQFLRRYFYIQGQPGSALAQALAFLAMVVAGLVVLRLSNVPSVPQVYMVLIVSSAIVCGFQAMPLWRRAVYPDRRRTRRFLRQHWRYGRWVLASIPVVTLSFQGYYYILSFFLSREELGYFKAAETFIGPFAQIAMGLSMFLIPTVARRIDNMSHEARRRLFARLSLLMMAVAICYSAPLAMFGGQVLLLAFGEAGEGATALIPVMAVVPLMLAASVPAGVGLTALKRPDSKLVAYVCTAAATFAIGVPLVYWLGLLGGALGLASSRLVFAVAQWALLTRTWRTSSAAA